MYSTLPPSRPDRLTAAWTGSRGVRCLAAALLAMAWPLHPASAASETAAATPAEFVYGLDLTGGSDPATDLVADFCTPAIHRQSELREPN